MIRHDTGSEIALDVVADGIDEPWKPVDLRTETKQYGDEDGA